MSEFSLIHFLSQARKDLEKATEQIRRLETDLQDKEQQRKDEQAAAEAKLRKAIHDEATAQKVRLDYDWLRLRTGCISR